MTSGRLCAMFCALVTFQFIMSSESGTNLCYVIEENQPPDYEIGDVMTDANLTSKVRDVGDPGRLHFSVLRGAGACYITVNATSGVLKSAMMIDREAVCAVGHDDDDECYISVDVVVTSPRFFDVIHVRIIVTDVNDNAPTFPQPEVTLHIPESAAVGSGFDIPVADDPDAGKNGIRTYYIVKDRTPFGVVATETDFGPCLQIVLVKQLDRETLNAYSITVVAEDGGDVILSGTIRIHVNILDVNDNIPRFTLKTYSADVTENTCVSSPIITVSASDPDLGEFGRVRYGLSDQTHAAYGDTFRINTTNGHVTLQRTLDYETQMTYRLTVVAWDGGDAVPGRTSVLVHVTDENDNDPVITFTVFTASGSATVSKSADPGTFVALVSVTDADSERNGAVSCVVGLENDAKFVFGLKQIQDKQYKLVTTTALNFTNQTMQCACVLCRDWGEPQRGATSCLNVTVLEENANVPLFKKPSYFASIAENNQVGAFLLRVRASDSDDGVNGVIEYMVAADNATESCCAINIESGVIRAQIVFDFEREPLYEFRVRATDGGTRANYADVTVVVYVLNRNDEVPMFFGLPYSFVVSESVPVNTSVGRVVARDADSEPFNVIDYVIVSAADQSIRVDPETGELSTTRRLDREAQANYVIDVVARNAALKVGLSFNCVGKYR